MRFFEAGRLFHSHYFQQHIFSKFIYSISKTKKKEQSFNFITCINDFFIFVGGGGREGVKGALCLSSISYNFI